MYDWRMPIDVKALLNTRNASKIISVCFWIVTLSVFFIDGAGPTIKAVLGILAAVSTLLAITFHFRVVLSPPPVDRYQELVAIKDRLYRDLDRLQTLVGRDTATANVQKILLELGLAG
jgi:hypothetical protein